MGAGGRNRRRRADSFLGRLACEWARHRISEIGYLQIPNSDYNKNVKLSRHAKNKCRLYNVDHAFVASLMAMPGPSVIDPATNRINIVREAAGRVWEVVYVMERGEQFVVTVMAD